MNNTKQNPDFPEPAQKMPGIRTSVSLLPNNLPLQRYAGEASSRDFAFLESVRASILCNLFPLDPGGGSGDAAWIRYHARSGESTTFEIGTSNDANDHIVLRPNLGNVGIGNSGFIPASKLDVGGTVKAAGFRIGGTTLTEDGLKVLKSLANDNAHVHVNIDTGILGISTRGTAVIHVPG